LRALRDFVAPFFIFPDDSVQRIQFSMKFTVT
jgi:hypothetical protein